MLRSFRALNYGLFRQIEMDWSSGFTAVTGESGAGKSQLLAAMLSLLGERWDSSKFGPLANMVKLAGEFEVGAEHPLWSQLADFDLEPDDMLTVTREVSPDARSIFRIQGRTVPRQTVADIAPWLIEVMHQGHVSRFSNNEAWTEWLDRYLNLLPLVDEVTAAYTEWQALVKQQEQLALEMLDVHDWTRQREILEEIDQAQIQPGEDSQLTEQLERFRSLNRLQQAYERVYRLIEDDSEHGLLSLLRMWEREVAQLAQLDPRVDPLRDQVLTVVETTLDVRHELAKWWEDFERDPLLQERLEARSDLLAQLKRRYGPDLDSVLAYAEQIRQDLERHQTMAVRSAQLSETVKIKEAHYRKLAKSLSEARQSGMLATGRALTKLLQQLEMPAADLSLRIEAAAPGPRGMDAVTFWFSANLGRDPLPLPKSASGGELARIGLSMAVLVRGEPASTLWLDEVDTGLGGRSAARVAAMMADLGKELQIIAITHQPVVASRADHQVIVKKSTDAEHTEAQISLVNDEERVEEVARMLSGGVEPTALQHARLLLGDPRSLRRRRS